MSQLKKISAMKGLKLFSLIGLLILSMSVTTFATERVICDVDVLSENSAVIDLSWQEGINKTSIRIIGWSVLSNGILQVTYEAYTTTLPGLNKRVIMGQDLKFPMKVILVEKDKTITTFKDMPNSEMEKFSILNLYDRGIISGYPGGMFLPQNNVNRAEFAKMLTQTAGFSLAKESTSSFKDISQSFWARPYILTLADKEIFKGRANGLFDPNGQITIGEVLAVLNRTFQLYGSENTYSSTLTTHWSNNDFLAMVKGGIVKPADSYYYPYTPSRKATRVECAVLLSRILEQLHQTK